MVRAAAERFDWWSFEGQPRAEIDVYQLIHLRELATRNRWLLRRSRRFKTTKAALALLDDPERLWWAVTRALIGTDDYLAMVAELVALPLLDGPAEYIGPGSTPSELALSVADELLAQGWRQGNTLLTLHDVDRDIHEPLRAWRPFGLLEKSPWRDEEGNWLRPTETLSEVGVMAASSMLPSARFGATHLPLRLSQSQRDSAAASLRT